jgi:hypothetical protein
MRMQTERLTPVPFFWGSARLVLNTTARLGKEIDPGFGC